MAVLPFGKEAFATVRSDRGRFPFRMERVGIRPKNGPKMLYAYRAPGVAHPCAGCEVAAVELSRVSARCRSLAIRWGTAIGNQSVDFETIRQSFPPHAIASIDGGC